MEPQNEGGVLEIRVRNETLKFHKIKNNSKSKVKIFLRQIWTFWTSQLFFHFSYMRGVN